MAAKRPRAGREQRIALGEDLRIGRASELYARLSAADPKATVVIDASSVAKMDAAGLQALAVCVGQWRVAGTQWRWDQPAPALIAAARQAGLEAALGLE